MFVTANQVTASCIKLEWYIAKSFRIKANKIWFCLNNAPTLDVSWYTIAFCNFTSTMCPFRSKRTPVDHQHHIFRTNTQDSNRSTHSIACQVPPSMFIYKRSERPFSVIVGNSFEVRWGREQNIVKRWLTCKFVAQNALYYFSTYFLLLVT